MIRYLKGNILDAESEALVNTVNTAGVMGKGIALQFKDAFPENAREYLKACKEGRIQIGRLLVVPVSTMKGNRIIINFPTKTEWYRKSRYEYIEKGLKDLVRVIKDLEVRSVAIPPLGCGNGGLRWDKVRPLMEEHLGSLVDVDVILYEPNPEIRRLLSEQPSKSKAKLTPARAMLLYSLFSYERSGEVSSLFVANKLAYFLQRMGEQLKLKFAPRYYGPFSHQVAYLLRAVNGKYLTGLEQMSARPFDSLRLNYSRYDEVRSFVENKLTRDQVRRLRDLLTLVEGFESAMALEVLSTVDYVKSTKPGISRDDLIREVKGWSKRKEELVKPRYVDVALKHLAEYGQKISQNV